MASSIPSGIPPSVIAMCPHLSQLAAAGGEVALEPVDGLSGSTPSKPVVPSFEPSQTAPALPAVRTAPPDPSVWASASRIETILRNAATVSTPANPLGDIIDNSLTGRKAQLFDAQTAKEITQFQERQAKSEGSDTMPRLIHRKQLFGGQAEIHWNPAMNQHLRLFGLDSQQSLIRLSDASNSPDPDGKSMYGMALEVTGRDGHPTDILMTGGSPLTEHSQARDPQAQLDLFNMLNAPSKIEGLARIVEHEGPVSGPRMLLDVERMYSKLDTAANLTAWSRAPFGVQGRDGKEYLVKMRAVPVEAATPLAADGTRSGDRLQNEFQARVAQGEVRWRLDFQFAQPKIDDVDDPRENWHGPWLAAGEIVVPQTKDPKVAQQAADQAENTKFSVWKNKDNDSVAVDKAVLRPFGEINRAASQPTLPPAATAAAPSSLL